jgi:hypothetical protein
LGSRPRQTGRNTGGSVRGGNLNTHPHQGAFTISAKRAFRPEAPDRLESREVLTTISLFNAFAFRPMLLPAAATLPHLGPTFALTIGNIHYTFSGFTATSPSMTLLPGTTTTNPFQILLPHTPITNPRQGFLN